MFPSCLALFSTCVVGVAVGIKSGTDYQLISEQFYSLNAILAAFAAISGPDSCYDKVGCFSNKSPYGLPARLAAPPEHPRDVCTDVILSTDQVHNQTLTIYPEISPKLKKLYKPNLRTYILCHGYINTGYDDWIHDLSSAILARSPANVFIVNWARGANGKPYIQSSSNTRIAAAVVDLMIEELVALGADLSNFHLIGHSLGAQIMAEVGERHKKGAKIGWITGLEPAGPGFYGPPEIRFDPDDAIFTDSIRTNVGLEGTKGKVADINFYFNQGTFQPNCLTDEFATPEVKFYLRNAYLQCSHTLAHLFYTESIKHPNCFKGRPATVKNIAKAALNSATVAQFVNITAVGDNCGATVCVPLGLETINYQGNSGDYVITTSLIPPYCTG